MMTEQPHYPAYVNRIIDALNRYNDDQNGDGGAVFRPYPSDVRKLLRDWLESNEATND